MGLRKLFLIVVLNCLISTNIAAAYKHDLAVVTIFRNEGPYLKEWLEYYLLMGVEHFYLYNHMSEDNYKEVLAPYIKKGLVDLYDWPYPPENHMHWRKIQVDAYKDNFEKIKDKVKWLAIIDSDEFIVPVKTPNLKNFLNLYDSPTIGGVTVGWIMFGTSNVKKIPDDKLMIDVLTQNAGPKTMDQMKKTGSFKSIIRPDRVKRMANAHYVRYKQGFSQFRVDYDEAQINHYWTRDEYYFYNFKLQRRVGFGQNKDIMVQWKKSKNKIHPEFAEPIRRFIPALKMRMGLEE